MKSAGAGVIVCVSFAALLLGTLGCSGTDYPSSGTVRFSNGEPVRSGSIEFRSIKNRLAYASRIASDGAFLLKDKHGNAQLPPDEYEIVVVQIVLTEDLAAEDHQHGQTVPRRYADYYTSGLRYVNLPGRLSPIEIELKAD